MNLIIFLKLGSNVLDSAPGLSLGPQPAESRPMETSGPWGVEPWIFGEFANVT